MKSVSIHEAKTQLSRLIREVEEGREIVIRRGKQPVARLVPEKPAGKLRRQPGGLFLSERELERLAPPLSEAETAEFAGPALTLEDFRR